MIFIVVVRRARCEICHGCFDLKAEERCPKTCRLCGAGDWLYGRDDLESRYIRQKVKRISKTLDGGGVSLKRRERGRRQVRNLAPKQKPGAPVEKPVAK